MKDKEDVHSRIKYISHREIKDKVEECLFKFHTFPECNVSLAKADGP